ncbi:MAG: hypothetical protein V4632_20325 [Pseudomonadota bacterium]
MPVPDVPEPVAPGLVVPDPDVPDPDVPDPDVPDSLVPDEPVPPELPGASAARRSHPANITVRTLAARMIFEVFSIDFIIAPVAKNFRILQFIQTIDLYGIVFG